MGRRVYRFGGVLLLALLLGCLPEPGTYPDSFKPEHLAGQPLAMAAVGRGPKARMVPTPRTR